jgi:hypothetical protein
VTRMATCPCCNGKRRLILIEHDDDGSFTITKPECCHCEGKGEVPSELKVEERGDER